MYQNYNWKNLLESLAEEFDDFDVDEYTAVRSNSTYIKRHLVTGPYKSIQLFE